jgi:hypothetical protein
MLYYTNFILLPFLLFLCILGFLKRRNYDTAHSLIFYALLFALLSEVLLRLSAWYFRNNIIIYNLSSLMEFLIFFLFYYKFIGSGLSKPVYLLILFVFLFFYVMEFINKGAFTLFSYFFLYKNFCLIVLAIFAFRKIIADPKEQVISNYSVFWINTSILIYYSCTFFLFGLKRYTLNLPLLSMVTFYLHLFFIFIFYGLLSLGLWKTSGK